MSYNWYILQVRPGTENRAVSSVEAIPEEFGEGKFIEEVFFPSCEGNEDDSSSGKKKVRKLMSGYLFIRMDMKKGSLNKILDIPSISRFLSDGREPNVISQGEIDRIKKNVETVQSHESVSITIDRGDKVEVTDGIMKSFTGEVISVDQKKQVAKVMVMILGRALPVELEIQKIKRVD